MDSRIPYDDYPVVFLPAYENPPAWIPPHERVHHPDYNNELTQFLPRTITLKKPPGAQLGFNIRGGKASQLGIFISKIIIAKKRGLCTRKLQPTALPCGLCHDMLTRLQESHFYFQPLPGIVATSLESRAGGRINVALSMLPGKSCSVLLCADPLPRIGHERKKIVAWLLP
ncbi:hypothetical protein H8959_000489 [Pygathrix nigripes]